MFNEYDQDNEDDVPEIFRGMSKNKIHDNLSRIYVLPEKSSRCNSKLYYYNVHRDFVFRITKEELLNFEATLSAEELVKAPF